MGWWWTSRILIRDKSVPGIFRAFRRRPRRVAVGSGLGRFSFQSIPAKSYNVNQGSGGIFPFIKKSFAIIVIVTISRSFAAYSPKRSVPGPIETLITNPGEL